MLSIGWIVLWVAYLLIKFEEFSKLKWNEIGDTAAGFASPLAFLWLVVGYYLQREELALQRREFELQRAELSRSADQIAIQAKLLEESVRQGGTQLALEITTLLIRDLSGRMADILNEFYKTYEAILKQKGHGGHHYGAWNLEAMWSRYAAGDHYAFFRWFARFVRRNEAARDFELVAENNSEITAQIEIFIRQYNRYVVMLGRVNRHQIISGAIEGTALSSSYEFLSDKFPLQNEDKIEVILAPPTPPPAS